MRGKLTDEIKAKSLRLLGYEITQKELRLMPYLQYSVMNSQNIDPNRIDKEEREILSRWRDFGYIEGGACDLCIAKEFWDAINAILWLGYVSQMGDEMHDNWEPESHWDEHPAWAVSEWADEVKADDTRQSYIDWVNSRLEED